VSPITESAVGFGEIKTSFKEQRIITEENVKILEEVSDIY